MWWCLNNREWKRNMQLEQLEQYTGQLESIVHTLDVMTLTKLKLLANAIEFCRVDQEGNAHIKFKKSVVIEAEDHIINYTKEGMIIDKANMIHLNPEPVNAQGVQSLAILEKQIEHKG